jgi:hypothetical protein
MTNKINLKQLRKELQNLHYWQPLYKVLKDELTKLGYWKLKKRGNPVKAYQHGWGKHVK